MREEDLLKAAAFIKRGKNKRAVFLALGEPILPNELVLKVFGKKSENAYSIVSRALKELKKEDLVNILNPEERTGRVWLLTDKGKAVYKKLGKR